MKRTLVLSLFASFVLLMSCNKDASNTTLKINLTDAPLDAEEVNIDLQAVRVNFTDFEAPLPGSIQVFDNSNNEVDIYDSSNYLIQTATLIGREKRW